MVNDNDQAAGFHAKADKAKPPNSAFERCSGQRDDHNAEPQECRDQAEWFTSFKVAHLEVGRNMVTYRLSPGGCTEPCAAVVNHPAKEICVCRLADYMEGNGVTVDLSDKSRSGYLGVCARCLHRLLLACLSAGPIWLGGWVARI